MVVKIKGKKLPTSYSDITWAKYLKIDEFRQNNWPQDMPSALEEMKPAHIMRFNQFKAKYVAFLLGLEVMELRQACDSHGKITIADLYNASSHLMNFPDEDEIEQKDEIRIGGKLYVRSRSGLDALGNAVQFQNVDWDALEEGQGVMMYLSKEGARTENLTLLTAVLFRPPVKRASFWFWKSENLVPEPYDYERAIERAKEFKKAPASDIIASYFFLLRACKKLKQDSAASFIRKLRRAQRRQKLLSEVNKRLLALRFGRFTGIWP